MLNRDPELKRQRGYTDPKSYVRNDGSERLAGQDWLERKVELFLRCNGRCEWMPVDAAGSEVGVFRCAAEATDAHHIVPRSKGRNDQINNLLALCRYHHDLLDKRKPRWSTQKEAV